MLCLLNFNQVSTCKFILTFNKKIRDGYVLFKDGVPSDLQVDAVQSEVEERVGIAVGRFTVEVEIPESVDSRLKEYSVVLVLRPKGGVSEFFSKRRLPESASDTGFYYLELVRQPSAWLYSTFRFVKPEGYTILGRRTVDAGATGGRFSPLSLEFNSVPDVSSISNVQDDSLFEGIAQYPELLVASKIIRTLWSGEMQDSPTDQSYSCFIQQRFEEKLDQIRGGNFPLVVKE